MTVFDIQEYIADEMASGRMSFDVFDKLQDKLYELEDKEAKLYEKIRDQRRQLTETQMALERRNSEIKPRWQKQLDQLKAENDILHVLVFGMHHCSKEDADGRECPLYDESEPYNCKKDKLMKKLGIDEEVECNDR